jgi:hypothetical protein
MNYLQEIMKKMERAKIINEKSKEKSEELRERKKERTNNDN